MRSKCWLLILLCVWLAGCGTTRWSDSTRTATEQMLVSDALDRAVSQLDLRALAGRTVCLDTTYLKGVVDADYLVSSVRQHALASGCILRSKQEEADYVMEIRAGSVGTDRHDVLFGIPATNIPTVLGTAGIPTQVPELPFVKRTDQRAVAKIAMFAYNRQTGRPIWQSGIVPVESAAKALWVMGAGPFRRGTIYDGTRFAGDKFSIPLIKPGETDPHRNLGQVSVAAEAYFAEPDAAATMARRDPVSPVVSGAGAAPDGSRVLDPPELQPSWPPYVYPNTEGGSLPQPYGGAYRPPQGVDP